MAPPYRILWRRYVWCLFMKICIYFWHCYFILNTLLRFFCTQIVIKLFDAILLSIPFIYALLDLNRSCYSARRIPPEKKLWVVVSNVNVALLFWCLSTILTILLYLLDLTWCLLTEAQMISMLVFCEFLVFLCFLVNSYCAWRQWCYLLLPNTSRLALSDSK